jgi:hypothetical protein
MRATTTPTNHILKATDNATRVRLNSTGTDLITVIVGDTNETWPEGCYIEVVSISSTAAVMVDVAIGSGVTLTPLSGTNFLKYGEYARVSLVSPGVWDMHVYAISAAPTAAPDYEVVLGFQGTGTQANPYFTYNPALGAFNVNYAFSESPYATVNGPSPVMIHGANANGLDQDGAAIAIVSGDGSGLGAQGNITLNVGHTMGDGKAGDILLRAGTTNALGSWVAGGCVFVRAGTTYGTTADSVGGLIILEMGSQDQPAFDAGKSGIVLKSGGTNLGLDPGPAIVVNGKCAIGVLGSVSASNQYGGEVAVETANYGAVGYVLRSNGQTSPVGWEAPEFKPAPLTVVNTASTLLIMGAAGDHNTLVRCNAATTVSVQVKLDGHWTSAGLYWEALASQSPMPPGGTMLFSKTGTGDVVFVPDVGVTINTPATLTITKRHGKITLVKVGPNEWDLEGNLAP